MITVIICAILAMLGVAASLYQVHTLSDQAPEVGYYEYWWMSLPM
jgi:hypothetical protein